MGQIAAIRLRGKWNIKTGIEDTLTLLGIRRKNNMVILENTKNNIWRELLKILNKFSNLQKNSE